MEEKRKRLLPMWNGQVPYCVEINEDEDPYNLIDDLFGAIYSLSRWITGPPQASPLERTLLTARCSVCGDGIDAACCSCPVCEAPYHNDCWEYMDQKCSIYGCSTRR